jgi:hypothetical protein
LNGDGCSSICEIEQNWLCSGGSPTSQDICYIDEPDILMLNVTENNNLILIFSRPINVTKNLTLDDFDIIITRYDGRLVKEFEPVFNEIDEFPSTRIYIRLKL